MDNSANNIPAESKTSPKKPFKNKKLFIFVGVIFVILIIVLSLILFMKNPPSAKKQVSDTSSSKATVKLKTQYKNPFDKDTQYVNPFSGYKNPFDQLK